MHRVEVMGLKEIIRKLTARGQTELCIETPIPKEPEEEKKEFKRKMGDFSGGPVVKTVLPKQRTWVPSRSGAKILHAAWAQFEKERENLFYVFMRLTCQKDAAAAAKSLL